MEEKLKLGDSTVTLLIHGEPTEDNVVFLNVHEDETTSVEALNQYAANHSIYFFRLMHHGTRRVAFDVKGKKYSVDPNRIFTKKGRKKTLKDGRRYRKKARIEAKKLAAAILAKIPEGSTVVAVHNNSDLNYSIRSYLIGGSESKNTAALHINTLMDADDFIYTTDVDYYLAFKALNINVILQDNKNYVNDGSLSAYCGEKGIRYINIETQLGHLDEQLELLAQVEAVIAAEKNK